MDGRGGVLEGGRSNLRGDDIVDYFIEEIIHQNRSVATEKSQITEFRTAKTDRNFDFRPQTGQPVSPTHT